MNARVFVARGRRLEELPPSRAPRLLLLGFALLVAGAALRTYERPSTATSGSGAFVGGLTVTASIASLATYGGLSALLAGAVAAWLRLTHAGRALVAAPTLAWACAFALGARRGGEAHWAAAARAAAPTVGVVAAALSVIAVFFIVQTRGIRTGRLRRGAVRTHRDAGPAECRLTEEGLTLALDPADTADTADPADTAERASHALADLGPPRLERHADGWDLVIVDLYGDPLLHLRGRSEAERAAMRAVAEELWRRLGAAGRGGSA